ncbi:MAG: biotin/lipoyl-containing protein [Thermoanaerobaculia bacterium]
MKYQARFSGDPAGAGLPVEVTLKAPGFRLLVDGRALSGEAARLRPGVWSLVFDDGRQWEVSLEPSPDGEWRARFGNAVAVLDLKDELTARAAASGGRSRAKKGDVVTAAMPGRVLRISVAAGQSVVAGEPLLVLEAMKMENEVKSPRDGVIDSIGVAAGQAVSAGEILIRLKNEA